MLPRGTKPPQAGEVWRRAGGLYAVERGEARHGRVRLYAGLSGVAFEAQAAIWFGDRLRPTQRLFACPSPGEALLWAVALEHAGRNGNGKGPRIPICPELARALERVRAVAGIQGGQFRLPFDDEKD